MVILRVENGQLGSRRREILRGSTIIGANFDNRNSQYGLAKTNGRCLPEMGSIVRFYKKHTLLS